MIPVVGNDLIYLDELIDKNAPDIIPFQEENEFGGRDKYDQIREKGPVELKHVEEKDGTIINILRLQRPSIKTIYSRGTIFTVWISHSVNKLKKRCAKAHPLKKNGFKYGDVIVIIRRMK